ncbi:STAS domain-containing protein [Nonomuraea polychroma]|uniref:STAS domain-containing protein n=1 Tax=Nonomuraea polychroma TaxID=46176 RepID=UPI003D8DF03D
MTPLNLDSRQLINGVLISVSGEIDTTNADQLESFAGQVRRPGEPLVLDLSGLTFLDSTGLNVLLRLNSTAQEQGGGLHLAALRKIPARLLKITGVDRAMQIHANVDEAIAALAASSAVPPESAV